MNDNQPHMTVDLAKCRCTAFTQLPCKRLASQEDLHCDVCRRGCTAVRSDQGGGWYLETGHLDLRFDRLS